MAPKLGQHSLPSRSATAAAVVTEAQGKSRHGLLGTYDVFDTVVTRLVGSPTAVFLILGGALVRDGLWLGTAQQFALARVRAEEIARFHSSTGEVQLGDIYLQLCHFYQVSEEGRKLFEYAELRIEHQLIRGVPEVLARIALERAHAAEIAFISDMYLPSLFIRQLLEETGAMYSEDNIWVSGELGKTKGNGNLYDHICSEINASPEHWQHMGDNVRADIESAAARRISPVHFSRCHLTSQELLMDSFGAETCGMSSLMAGAARWTRLTDQESEKGGRAAITMNGYVTNVAGPAVCSFVLWVLSYARRHSVRRIWFMARDGQVMVPMAADMCRRLGETVEIGYLYAGRQVVKLAALQQIDESALAWMLHGLDEMDLGALLIRLGLLPDELILSRASLFRLPQDGLLRGAENLVQSFILDTAVSTAILAAASQRRDLLLRYLRGCGLISGEPSIIVDIGWRGTVAQAFDNLIGRDESGRHHYLYFGLRSRPESTLGLRMQGFLFDHAHEKSFGVAGHLESMSLLMETFCQADHGPVFGLREAENGFEPICGSQSPTPSDGWDVKYFQQRLLSFAKAFLVELAPNIHVDLRGLVADLIRSSLTQPDRDQARLFSTVLFADGPEGLAALPVVRAYRLADLPAAFAQAGWPRFGSNWWLPAARVLTPRAIRALLRCFAKLGRMARKLPWLKAAH